MRESVTGKVDYNKVSLWLVLLAMGAGGVSRLVSLEEAKAIGIKDRAEAKQDRDKLKEQIADIKSNSDLKIAVTRLEVQVNSLTEQVKALRSDIREPPRKRGK